MTDPARDRAAPFHGGVGALPPIPSGGCRGTARRPTWRESRRPEWPLHGARRSGHGSPKDRRSEEHTSELQSLMRISYAVFCLKKKTKKTKNKNKIDRHIEYKQN